MTDQFDTTPDDGEEEEGSFSDAFSEMDNALSGVPEGEFITLRNGANRPVYVPLFEGETGISIAQAVGRAGLTVGVVQYYLDNNAVAADTTVPGGGVVEIIGNVKGG
jgi:hypothetical protein